MILQNIISNHKIIKGVVIKSNNSKQKLMKNINFLISPYNKLRKLSIKSIKIMKNSYKQRNY
jgi:hypothetical protein